MSDGSDTSEGSESYSSNWDGSSTGSWSGGNYDASMEVFNQATNSLGRNQGPGAAWDAGEAYTPGLLDSAKDFFTSNAGPIGRFAGGVLGGPLGSLVGGLAGEAYGKYSKSDVANGITTYNPDGTVSGYQPSNTGNGAQTPSGSGSTSANYANTGGNGWSPSGGNSTSGGTSNNAWTAGRAGGATGTILGQTAATAGQFIKAPSGLSTADTQAWYAQQAARQTTGLNRPDQSTPFGNQTWTQDPNNPDKWSSSITLSPTQQALQDAQDKNALAKSDLSRQILDKLNTEKLPQYQDSVELEKSLGMKDNLKLNTNIQLDPVKAAQTKAAIAAAAAAGIDLSSLTALPEVSDAVRQRVEDALYQRETSRLDPMWAARQDAFNTQLANQGITLGSGAYDTSTGQFGRDRNDAYQLALNTAIEGGGAEQSRLFDLALKPRQQQFAEQSKVADVNVSNADRAAQVSMANAANATQTAIANANRELEAAKISNQNKLDTNAQINAALLNQTNSNNSAMLGNATFGNTAKLNEMSANNNTVNQILGALTSLQTGTSPTLPQFASGQSGASISPVNSAQITQAEQQTKQAKDNAKTQTNNAIIAALGGLGSSLIDSW